MFNLKSTKILINMEPKSKDTQLNRRNLSWLQEQSVDIKISLLQNHLSICQIMINELLEEEVIQKAGSRYSRDKPFDGRFSRWGFNPGSVRIGDQKLKIDVPRLYDNERDKNTMLDRYLDLKQLPEPTEQLINGVLLGLSMRDYAKVIDHLGEGFGMSKSSISRSFIDRTEEKLKEFESRSLAHLQIIALFIDGKYLSKEQIIICMGVTLQGEKIPLGFVQAATENSGGVRGTRRPAPRPTGRRPDRHSHPRGQPPGTYSPGSIRHRRHRIACSPECAPCSSPRSSRASCAAQRHTGGR